MSLDLEREEDFRKVYRLGYDQAYTELLNIVVKYVERQGQHEMKRKYNVVITNPRDIFDMIWSDAVNEHLKPVGHNDDRPLIEEPPRRNNDDNDLVSV